MVEPLHVIIDKEEEKSPSDILVFFSIVIFVIGLTIFANTFDGYFEGLFYWALLVMILGALGIFWRIRFWLFKA